MNINKKTETIFFVRSRFKSAKKKNSFKLSIRVIFFYLISNKIFRQFLELIFAIRFLMSGLNFQFRAISTLDGECFCSLWFFGTLVPFHESTQLFIQKKYYQASHIFGKQIRWF